MDKLKIHFDKSCGQEEGELSKSINDPHVCVEENEIFPLLLDQNRNTANVVRRSMTNKHCCFINRIDQPNNCR